MADPIVVTTDPARIQMKPGEQATATATIRNRSEEVEHYELRVEGVPEGWADVAPNQVSAFPLQEVRAQVRIHPPEDAQGAIYSLIVRAVSQSRPDIQATGRIELDIPIPVQPVVTPPVEQPPTSTGEPAPHPITPPVTGPGPVMASQIEVIAEPVEDSPLPPPAAQWRLRLRNAGNVLDTFSFNIAGIRPTWVSIDPTAVTLKPGEESIALLTVRPSEDTAVGIYPFTLRIFSHLNLNQRTEVQLKVEVKPSSAFALNVWPQDAEAQGMREFDVSLVSDKSSNTDVWIDLAASDPENACDYTFDPAHVLLQVRQTVVSKLRIRPRVALGPNERRLIAFTVVATPRGGPPEAARSAAARLTLIGAPPPTLDLRPRVQTGTLEAEYVLQAVNLAGVATTLVLSGEDPEEACEYIFEPPKLIIPARGQAQAKVTVRARAYAEGEGEKSHPFTIMATREGDLLPVAQTDGTFNQKRIRPVSLELIPPQQSGPRGARYSVKVSNPRTKPVQIWLDAKDEAAALAFTVKPNPINLSPGAEGIATLDVRAKDKLTPGEQRRVHQFVVAGVVDGSTVLASTTGILAQVRGAERAKVLAAFLRLGGRLLKWAIILFILAFLLVLLLAGMQVGSEGNTDLQAQVAPILSHPISKWFLGLPIAEPARALVRFFYQILFAVRRVG